MVKNIVIKEWIHHPEQREDCYECIDINGHSRGYFYFGTFLDPFHAKVSFD